MEGKYIEEMQFVIYLFLRITQIKGNFTDDFKKKEVCGIVMMTTFTKIALKSYVNRILLTRLLTSRFLNIFPDLTSEERESTLFALLVKKESLPGFVGAFADLIKTLYPIQEMKTMVLRELFNYMTSK